MIDNLSKFSSVYRDIISEAIDPAKRKQLLQQLVKKFPIFITKLPKIVAILQKHPEILSQLRQGILKKMLKKNGGTFGLNPGSPEIQLYYMLYIARLSGTNGGLLQPKNVATTIAALLAFKETYGMEALEKTLYSMIGGSRAEWERRLSDIAPGFSWNEVLHWIETTKPDKDTMAKFERIAERVELVWENLQEEKWRKEEEHREVFRRSVESEAVEAVYNDVKEGSISIHLVAPDYYWFRESNITKQKKIFWIDFDVDCGTQEHSSDPEKTVWSFEGEPEKVKKVLMHFFFLDKFENLKRYFDSIPEEETDDNSSKAQWVKLFPELAEQNEEEAEVKEADSLVAEEIVAQNKERTLEYAGFSIDYEIDYSSLDDVEYFDKPHPYTLEGGGNVLMAIKIEELGVTLEKWIGVNFVKVRDEIADFGDEIFYDDYEVANLDELDDLMISKLTACNILEKKEDGQVLFNEDFLNTVVKDAEGLDKA